MGWGIGNGIGWPNASASAGPPPPQESYSFYDSVSQEYGISKSYNVGSFLPGYRVIVDPGKYGYIDTAIEPQDGTELTNLPIGYVDFRDLDATVQFTIQFSIDEGLNLIAGIRANNFGPILFTPNGTSNQDVEFNFSYNISYADANGDPATTNGIANIVISEYYVPAGSNEIISEYIIISHNASELFGSEYSMYNFLINSSTVYSSEQGQGVFLTDYGNAWRCTWYYS